MTTRRSETAHIRNRPSTSEGSTLAQSNRSPRRALTKFLKGNRRRLTGRCEDLCRFSEEHGGRLDGHRRRHLFGIAITKGDPFEPTLLYAILPGPSL